MFSIPLQHLNTFQLSAHANELIDVSSVDELEHLLPLKQPFLVLGSGSNVLFSENYQGTVLVNNIVGIEQWEDEHHHYFQVAGGENWHRFVMHCAGLNIGGLENLALIPGSVGAAPVQNIGAYGVELSQVCHEVIAFDINTGLRHVFTHHDCHFGYRESVFKQQRNFFITQVVFKLVKQWKPQLSYGELKVWGNELDETVTPKSIAIKIIDVRNSKLPNPDILPNVGSFFKNPVVSIEQASKLKNDYENMPQYNVDNGMKLAAGWLIEYLGLKGKNVGGAGVHENQALVLVNNNKATSSDVINLAYLIIEAVKESFNVVLEPEVNIIDRDGYSEFQTCYERLTNVQ